jgi:hypothetical protein
MVMRPEATAEIQCRSEFISWRDSVIEFEQLPVREMIAPFKNMLKLNLAEYL